MLDHPPFDAQGVNENSVTTLRDNNEANGRIANADLAIDNSISHLEHGKFND